MLGSSSTTRILGAFPVTQASAFQSAVLIPRLCCNTVIIWLSVFEGKQERKLTSTADFAFHPDFPAVRLHQSSRNSKPQAHASAVHLAIVGHLEEVTEDLLVIFRRYARSGIGNTHPHSIW